MYSPTRSMLARTPTESAVMNDMLMNRDRSEDGLAIYLWPTGSCFFRNTIQGLSIGPRSKQTRRGLTATFIRSHTRQEEL